VLVPLDGHARLAPHPNHKEACLYVDLDELERDALLIGHERQVALSAVKRKRRPAGDHEGLVYVQGLGDISAGDCGGHYLLLPMAGAHRGLSAALRPVGHAAR